MRQLLSLLPANVVNGLRDIRGMKAWADRGYPVPLPEQAKRSVLRRYGYPDATWVETGTFWGQTTAFLAEFSPRVITLEPAKVFYDRAVKKFAGQANVEVLNATSEDAFPTLLPTLTGKVNFWLDGHYSAGETFKGETNSPLYAELAAISDRLPHLEGVVILIDDIRLCGPMGSPDEVGYPTLNELVDWSDKHNLKWLIEHDIFVIASHFPTKLA